MLSHIETTYDDEDRKPTLLALLNYLWWFLKWILLIVAAVFAGTLVTTLGKSLVITASLGGLWVLYQWYNRNDHRIPAEYKLAGMILLLVITALCVLRGVWWLFANHGYHVTLLGSLGVSLLLLLIILDGNHHKKKDIQ